MRWGVSVSRRVVEEEGNLRSREGGDTMYVVD